MKGLFIINPSSGKQINQAKAIQTMSELLRDGIIDESTVFYTKKHDDAKNRAMTAKAEGYDFIVAAGGDGTVNEVVAGLNISGERIPIAIMPSGTTNDFAASTGIEPTVYCLYNLIKDFKVVDTDVGCLNDERYFLNVAAGGILSEVAHGVSIEAKTHFGKTAYFAEAIKRITTQGFKTKKLLFDMDGDKQIFDVYFFMFGNSKSVGGFPKMCADAKINDGYMDLCVIKTLDVIKAVPVFTQILEGSHMNNKQVEYRQVRDLKISLVNEEDEFHLDCDGEYAGELPAHIKVIKAGVQLLLPIESVKTKKVVADDNQSATLTN